VNSPLGVDDANGEAVYEKIGFGPQVMIPGERVAFE
jgi:hypothetical protein